jgi:hypothetical protein
MRKSIIKPAGVNPEKKVQEEWLDLEKSASVEITSEDPDFPIEDALGGHQSPGWRAAERGKQVIRFGA